MGKENQSDAKWVRVMADYTSCGLWQKDGCEAEEREIPISDILRARLKKWCDTYEKSEFYLPDEMRECGEFDLKGFSEEGLEIARAVKTELPEWTVIYHNEHIAHSVSDISKRSQFEYEIKA